MGVHQCRLLLEILVVPPKAIHRVALVADAHVLTDGIVLGPKVSLWCSHDVKEELLTIVLKYLDVRTEEEWAAGHASCAVRVPIQNDESLLSTVVALAGGDMLAPIVTYCYSGARAGRAADILTSSGFAAVTNGLGWVEPAGNAAVLESMCSCGSTGTYSGLFDQSACAACSGECEPGSFVSTPCTPTADRICSACALPPNTQPTPGIVYTCSAATAGVPSAAYAATLALDGDNIDEKAGDDGGIKRIAFSRWFAKDLAAKLTELGVKVAPSAITVTSVTAGSIIVDFDVIPLHLLVIFITVLFL